MSALDTDTRLTNPVEARSAIRERREPDWNALPVSLPVLDLPPVPDLYLGQHRRPEVDAATEVIRLPGEAATVRIPFKPSPRPRPTEPPAPAPVPDAPPADIPLLARILTALRVPRRRP